MRQISAGFSIPSSFETMSALVRSATDFRDVPIAHFSWRSFSLVIAFFVLSHVWWWEYPLMLVWAVGTQLWFYHRKHLMPLVIVHAVTNLSILAFVVVADGRFHDAAGNPISLWFFI